MRKGLCVGALGDKRAALALYGRAVGLLEELVQHDSRLEVVTQLATAYRNKAVMLQALGDHRSAVTVSDREIMIWQRLVSQEGRQEFVGEFAQAIFCRAAATNTLSRSFLRSLMHQPREAARASLLEAQALRDRAQGDVRTAMSLLSDEIARTGRADLNELLEWAKTSFRV